MKKHSMWIILCAILLVELIVYFVAVSPMGSIIAEKTLELKRATGKKGLGKPKYQSRNIPTRTANKLHDKNRKTLKDEYDSVVQFFKDEDTQSLKQWFSELSIKDWDLQPTPAQFQSRYSDQFNLLRKLCRDKGISISDKEARLLIELKSGEKTEGILIRDDRDLVLQVEGKEVVLPQEEIKSKMWVTLKLTQEEQAKIQAYLRFSQPPQENTDETVPDNVTGGFWETSKLNSRNLQTAQIQFWVQKAFVEALVYANGKQLVFVSFYRERAIRRGKGDAAQAPQNAIEEHFQRMPVTILVRMPYGSIARMLTWLNSKSGINLEFRNLKVTKPLLAAISTNPHASIKFGVTYTQADAFNGVIPKVFDKLGGVNFGTKAEPLRKMLPDQDLLISEPSVLIEFSYYVMLKTKLKPAAKNP